MEYLFGLADLDDTLYPLGSGLAKEVLKNIQGNWVSINLIIIYFISFNKVNNLYFLF